MSLLSFVISEDGTAHSSYFDIDDSKFKKHNLSIAMFNDDKIAFSLIGYSYNIKVDKMNEYFIGAGTALFAFTGSIGWKHYYIKDTKNILLDTRTSIYSILSEQMVAHIGFTGYMSTVSLSFEHEPSKLEWLKIKYGCFGFFFIRTDQSGNQFGLLPFIGLSFDF